MKIHKDLDIVAALLSCYDFRVSAVEMADRMGITDQHLRAIIRRVRKIELENMKKHRRSTIALVDHRAIGLQSVIAVVHSTEEIAKVFNAIRQERSMDAWFRLGLPLVRYLVSVSRLFGGKMLLTYKVPKRFVPDLVDGLKESLGDRISFIDVGYAVPVYNCARRIARSLEDIRDTYGVHADTFEGVVRFTPLNSRMRFVDVIVVTMVEYYPLLRNIDLRNVNLLAKARVEDIARKLPPDAALRLRYMKSHYDRLSEKGYIGRTWLGAVLHNGGRGYVGVSMIVASADCAEQLYVLAASTLSAPQLFIGEERVIATFLVNNEIRPLLTGFIEEYCSGRVYSENTVLESVAVPTPVEMFDPWRNDWGTRPHDVAEALKRFRLIE